MASILIAEDDDTSALILRRILESAGHRVERVRTGLEALVRLQECDVDALVTDWMMPEMDGLELVRKVHARFNPAPATVMVTCLSQPDARAHALESGADEFVNKPVRAQEVLDALSRALARLAPADIAPPVVPPTAGTPRVPFPIVAVGANAGGPQALRVLLRGCGPAAGAAAWVVAQNGLPEMLIGLMPILERETRMQVVLASDGLPLSPGRIALAPGGSHVAVDDDGRSLRLLREPELHHVRPSSDVLFRSAATAAGRRCVAIVLSGMGIDGTNGSAFVRAAGGTVLVASPGPRVASGMAESVVRAGLATATCPLESLGAALTSRVEALGAPAALPVAM